MKNLTSSILLLATGVLALLFIAQGKMVFYINPAYIPFATIAASVATFVGVVGMLVELKEHGPEFKKAVMTNLPALASDKKLFALLVSAILMFWNPLAVILLVVILFVPVKESQVDKLLSQPVSLLMLMAVMLVVGFLVPAKPLGSDAAGQLAGSLNNVVSAGGDEPSIVSLFSSDPSKYDVGDWIKRINFDPDLASYVDQEVTLTGFVYQPANFPEDTILLSRFMISCCAVDARPIGLPVHIPDWQADYVADQWLQVTGKFGLAELNGEQNLIVNPDSVTVVEQPDRPYIY